MLLFIHTHTHTHLNLKKIDWYSMHPTLNHTNADSQLILTSQRSHLIQTVLLPTHHTNITDLLFISIDNIITNVSVDMPFATSDHNTIRFDLFTPSLSSAVSPSHKSRPITNKISQLDFNRIDHAGLSACLLSANWDQIFSHTDTIDVAWDHFSNFIHSLLLKFTPKKKPSYSKRPDFMPPNIMRLIKLKREAWKFYKKYKSARNRKTFYRLAKTLKSSIMAFRNARKEQILLNGSIKQFFAYTRLRMCTISKIGPINNSCGHLVTDDSDKAEAFNDFFYSVYTHDDGTIPVFNKRTESIMPTPVLSVDEVRRVLMESTSSYACGPDGTPPVFLKKFPELFPSLYFVQYVHTAGLYFHGMESCYRHPYF